MGFYPFQLQIGLPVSGSFLAAPTQYAPGTPASPTTSSSTMAAVSSANVNTGSFIDLLFSSPGATPVTVYAAGQTTTTPGATPARPRRVRSR